MSIFGKSRGHFRAHIKIYPCGPTTRSAPPFNGIRWSFVYADDVENLGVEKVSHSDVWPEFIDDSGNTISFGTPLIGDYDAIMHIIFNDMIDVHFQRLRKGTQFYCMEGRRKMAEGRVTKLSVT